jgi:hypothetical protein
VTSFVGVRVGDVLGGDDELSAWSVRDLLQFPFIGLDILCVYLPRVTRPRPSVYLVEV